jgi:crossover junction endodeoxyribonuclease RuvC
MTNYYVGIDPSLTGTGLVVLDEKCSIICQTVISSKLKGIPRLIDIEESLSEELCKFFGDIKETFYENYSFGSRLGQAFSLGELGGVLKKFLVDNDVEYTVIAPASLKKFVTGKGNIKKEQMLLQIYKRYNQEFDNNNLGDAYGLAMFAYKYHNKDKIKLTQFEKEVIERIDKTKEEN